ncbi:DUF6275 family protein [Ligilactobacillus salivarius]|jgi:hypothetical protein|uniref:DUF6275 family protein n=1 Tax=Ligilactobacillus salivarius TaxID=1624 RepID=UPI00136A61C7|nr:DUF6275 family protein [Ligilactobacillus salivarius]MYY75922.1 hypothetical protein [Ligilactobacillus salivarius]MYZ03902.1 hypothetical protein [Ligilactobacillus salivarius]MYZ71802.1 hypothetical protein [Ligilactobacillus salivarius]MYZ77333.1 hypothetical protein [Ligilactobacillus salivarius]
MDNGKFVELCKEYVVNYAAFMNLISINPQVNISKDDVYVVWLNRTLQNNKALLSTTVEDGMYYEITYNGDKNEVYFDVYKHIENREIKLGDE